MDRVKNIFKLQQGEYIAPEKIENIYVRSRFVSQVFVYGSSLKSNLIGVVVPEEIVLFEWAKENNLESDMNQLCQNPELKKIILKDITSQGKIGGLKGFEQVTPLFTRWQLFLLESLFYFLKCE